MAGDADGADAADVADVAARLGVAVNEGADELEVGMFMDGGDGVAADGSGGPLNDAQHAEELTVRTTRRWRLDFRNGTTSTAAMPTRHHEFETLLYKTDGPVATITLNRPDHLNTIVPPMPDEIENAIGLAERDPPSRSSCCAAQVARSPAATTSAAASTIGATR